MELLKAVGIAAEYNPFHMGHKYHVEEAKEISGARVAVAIMSGDFVQRGEPAILDKWTRSRLAVEQGVDLVLELPYVYACSDAGTFASAGAALLSGMGGVTHMAFGSESADEEMLTGFADIIAEEPAGYKEKLREGLDAGMSYPAARWQALEWVCGSEKTGFRAPGPNDVLALEYLAAIKKLRLPLKPVIIKRAGAGYEDTDCCGRLSSAAAIRQAVYSNRVTDVLPAVSEETYRQLKTNAFTSGDSDRMFKMLKYRIITSGSSQLARIYGIREGLENRIAKAAIRSENMDQLVSSVKSARYTESYVRRCLMHILTGTESSAVLPPSAGICYGRVLAFNRTGGAFMKQIKKKKTGQIPLITNINKEFTGNKRISEALLLDIRSSNVYNHIRDRNLYEFSDHVLHPACVDLQDREQAD